MGDIKEKIQGTLDSITRKTSYDQLVANTAKTNEEIERKETIAREKREEEICRNRLNIFCDKYISILGIKEDMLDIGNNYLNNDVINISDCVDKDSYCVEDAPSNDETYGSNHYVRTLLLGKKIALSDNNSPVSREKYILNVRLGMYFDNAYNTNNCIPQEYWNRGSDNIGEFFSIKYSLFQSGVIHGLSVRVKENGNFDILPRIVNVDVFADEEDSLWLDGNGRTYKKRGKTFAEKDFDKILNLSGDKLRELSQDLLSDVYIYSTGAKKFEDTWALMSKYKTNPEINKPVENVKKTRLGNLLDYIKKL